MSSCDRERDADDDGIGVFSHEEVGNLGCHSTGLYGQRPLWWQSSFVHFYCDTSEAKHQIGVLSVVRFLVHLSRRLKCTIVIMRCPSSVVRLSVVRRLSLTFHIFDFSSETTERNLTKLYRKVELNVLYQVCVFRADRKNKMAALASDWLRHFRLLLWNHWTEFNETWQEARSQRPLPRLCFSGRSENQDGRPGLWLAETFSTFPLKPLNGIQRNLTGSKVSTSSTKFVFFWPIGKTRWPPLPLNGWDIFDFSSETTERNSTKLDRKQDLNVLYQVCVFRADRKNKMATLASDWLRHFRLFLWNRWTEFNETWQEARFLHPLPSLCFSGWSEKQNGPLANPPKRWHIVLRCTICGPLGLLFF